MKEIRGPRVPDSVPQDLVDAYGAGARHAVRYRRSRRYRMARRLGRWLGGRDPWYVLAAGLMWGAILGAGGVVIALAWMRWPRTALDVAVLLAAAAASSAITVIALNRRTPRDA